MRSKKEFLYVFASVLLSFILFINASSFNFQNNSSARQVSSETYTNTLTNIPIDAKYNDKTSSEIISGNYSGTISLNAVDAQGNVLPGLVNPSETRIKVTTKTSSSTSSSSSSSSTSSSSSN